MCDHTRDISTVRLLYSPLPYVVRMVVHMAPDTRGAVAGPTHCKVECRAGVGKYINCVLPVELDKVNVYM